MLVDGEKYSISNLSEISGISIPNIRIWEKRYKVFVPDRTSTNIRLYKKNDVFRIVLLKYLIDNGYKISEIYNLKLSELRNAVITLMLENNYYDEDLKSLINLLLNNKYVTFENYIEDRLTDISPNYFIFSCLEPLLRILKPIEFLKDDNDCFEYFINNKILQIINNNVSKIPIRYSVNSSMLILQSDQDIIPVRLCLVNYIANLKKYKTDIFLNKMSVQNIIKLHLHINPDIIYTEFNERQKQRDIDDYLKNISNTFSNSKIITSGKISPTVSSRIVYISDFKKLIDKINS